LLKVKLILIDANPGAPTVRAFLDLISIKGRPENFNQGLLKIFQSNPD